MASSVPAQGPALPWAASDASKQSPAPRTSKPDDEADADTNDVLAVSLDQLGMDMGARIEVLWTVHPDEGEPYQRWWGASITAAEPQQPTSTSGTSSSSGPPAYQLKHDSAPAEGFDEEELTEVQLLSEHRLLDVKQRDVMAWRVEGDTYQPPDEEEESEEGIGYEDADGHPEGGVVSLHQLAAGINEAEVAAGEADMLDMAGAMGAAGQLHMAAGYREMIDSFKAFISAKASSAPEGQLVITKEDAEDFKAMLATQLAQQRRGRH